MNDKDIAKFLEIVNSDVNLTNKEIREKLKIDKASYVKILTKSKNMKYIELPDNSPTEDQVRVNIKPEGKEFLDKWHDRDFKEKQISQTERIIKLEDRVKTSQYIIAGIMAITVLITLGSVWFSYQTYSLEFETIRPTILLFRHCQNFSSNGTLEIPVAIRNVGQLGAFVGIKITTNNIGMDNVREDGILIESINRTEVGKKSIFVDGKERKEMPFIANISGVTVPDFTSTFTATCPTKDCRFFGDKNIDVVECKYLKTENGYSLSPESTCVAQPSILKPIIPQDNRTCK